MWKQRTTKLTTDINDPILSQDSISGMISDLARKAFKERDEKLKAMIIERLADHGIVINETEFVVFAKDRLSLAIIEDEDGNQTTERRILLDGKHTLCVFHERYDSKFDDGKFTMTIG